jgi:hypothetical protein
MLCQDLFIAERSNPDQLEQHAAKCAKTRRTNRAPLLDGFRGSASPMFVMASRR